MRILGFIFISLLISSSLLLADFYLPGHYLSDFLSEHFIETFAALVGFNIAAVIFLVGQLMSLEDRLGVKKAFENTRREIKHNSYFLLSAFVACLVLLIIRPGMLEGAGWKMNMWYYLDNLFVLAIFSLAIFSIYEILRAVFMLSRNDLS